jgi:hypothetical protein
MPPIEKQQFKNNTGGFIGAVVITARGEDRGIAVEPDGYVWLSEEEQRLTANAPRRPEDNPFLEQELEVVDNLTGERSVVKVTPLTPVSEDRFIPANLRPIPADVSDVAAVNAAQAAATGPEPGISTAEERSVATRHAEVDQIGPDVQPGEPVQPTARAAAAAAAAQEEADALAGLATPQSEPEAPQEPQEAPQPPQEAPEETAAQTDPAIGEETGAAPQPIGPAPTGEFAQAEEVGTPVTPQQQLADATETGEGPAPQPPAPWSPGSEG